MDLGGLWTWEVYRPDGSVDLGGLEASEVYGPWISMGVQGSADFGGL